MADDTYMGFQELIRHEIPDRDFRIHQQDTGSKILIMAPHGGRIEPKTSEIAIAIAGKTFNLYCFEGLKPDHNRRLHLTSHRFNEPIAEMLLLKSATVVTIHACKGTEGIVYLGGLDTVLMDAIALEIEANRIKTSQNHPSYKGKKPDNLCNRGTAGKGVQLEITRDLRDDPEKTSRICKAVRKAISLYLTSHPFS